MKQSRKMSLVESISNVLVGYWLAVLINYHVLPLFGAPVSMEDSAWIGAIFTLISMVRSYIMRRIFEWERTRHG